MMMISAQPEISTGGIRAAIFKIGFEQPCGGVVKYNEWSLGFWLSSKLTDAEIVIDDASPASVSEIGPISLAPAASSIRWHATSCFAQGIVCRYTPAIFRELTGLDATDAPRNSKGLVSVANSDKSRLSGILREIGRELTRPDARGPIMIHALCTQAAVELGRLMRKPQCELSLGGLTPWQLRRVQDFLNEQVDLEGRVSEIAALCGLSNRHFSRAFKQSTGRTIGECVREVRLSRAQELLIRTREPLCNIAQKLGFPHASGFSIAFKRGTGLSPRAFRRQMQ